ncbi:hypothetical protein ANCCAN_15913 [Ancylostoma caninum]|uniref:Uncharacterized protein n=1 Tax=Ancylostoma caninum TaxID=29170 RepID=A0A368G4G0_ANCCA|nr:hypothetical protein ANCCAN_15913 [Ancylostoma caninum]
MPPSREPLKYLIYYPFSVLTVAKTFILIIGALTVCVWQWNNHPVTIGISLFVVPIFNLLGCAAALISMWFMVQKFYWKKVVSQ